MQFLGIFQVSSNLIGLSAVQIADRTRSNANLDWTCPTCIYEANGAGVPGITTDLLSRFNVCDSNFKGWILLSQSSLNINRSPTLPNVSLHVPDLSTNLSLPRPTASYEDDPNGIESSTNDARVQSLPDSGTVVLPESLRPTNRSRLLPFKVIVTHLSLPNQNGIDITKFNFKQTRDYSSFKTLVPDGLLSKLLCPNF